MGGQRKQFQVLVDPDLLLRYGVTLHEVKTALEESNQNTAGGYLDEQGPSEFLVRSLGRVKTVGEIGDIVVKHRALQSITLSQVARIVEGAQVKLGDWSAFARDASGTFTGGPAVVLTILKQPQGDTRAVTELVTKALKEMKPSLPKDVRILPGLYQQKEFIDPRH